MRTFHQNYKVPGTHYLLEGLQIDTKKVKIIIDLPHTRNISELWRLLGMTNQVVKFAKNLTDTIWPLLKKETEWIWNDEPRKTAFQTPKKQLKPTTIIGIQIYQQIHLAIASEEYFFRNKVKAGDLFSMHRDLWQKHNRNMPKLRSY